MPKLSVIIPTYNRSRLVTEAIDSVLAQECSHPIEVIVVDDGSEDDTPAVLQKYGERINYRRQPNRGMNAARNHGLHVATGDYIALLDSDDVWLPFKAKLQIEVMEKIDRAGFAFSNFYAWRNDERIPNGLGNWMVDGATIEAHASETLSSTELGIRFEGEPFQMHVCEIYRLSLYQPVVLPSTSITRRSVIEALGPLPEDNWMCGDWEYFARASKRFGAVYIDTETALNRSHDDAVRLMRRDLVQRTEQRLQSIQRTWGADTDFRKRFPKEVTRVESHERRILFKRACYAGDLAAAEAHLQEIGALLGHIPFGLRLLWWAAHVPGSRPAIAAIRKRSR